MARDFDGLTDKIEFTLADTVTYSVYESIKVDQVGDSEIPRGLEVAGSTTHPILPDLRTGKFSFNFRHQWSTGRVISESDADTVVLDTQHRFLVTYDGGSSGNKPIMYLDGSSINVNDVDNASGTRNSVAGTAIIGNNVAQTRSLDGEIGEFAWWNRILSAGEAILITNGFSPKFITRGLIHYISMIRDVKDEVGGATMTVTGTTVVSHPRTIYPSPPQIITASAAAAGVAGIRNPMGGPTVLRNPLGMAA